MCNWVTLLYSRKLTDHYKPAIMEKIKIITQIKKKIIGSLNYLYFPYGWCQYPKNRYCIVSLKYHPCSYHHHCHHKSLYILGGYEKSQKQIIVFHNPDVCLKTQMSSSEKNTIQYI